MKEEPTPLERRLDALGHRLVWLALGVAAVVAGLEAAHGEPIGVVIETGIALAVAAVPEALPVVATIALAVGLRRMARRHALVRRLPSVEALGSTTVICTDKTRTLTSGDMTVVRVWTADAEFDLGENGDAGSFDNPRLRVVLELAARASRPQAAHVDGTPSGGGRDPVDAAILNAAARVGIDRAGLGATDARAGLLPFSSERKLMATFDETGAGLVAYVKGAPGRLLAMSDRALASDGERPLDDEGRAGLRRVNDALAAEGLRVLAVAHGPRGQCGGIGPDRPDLRRLRRLHGSPGSRREGDDCASARGGPAHGDGDRRSAPDGRSGRPGAEPAVVERSDRRRPRAENALGRRAARSAGATWPPSRRVTPEDKLVIVTALQARGEIVAMLGDGVNDAAALKKADVGVAMGLRGTDVAKEAAAIVLQDDRFETIAAAVEEGRVVYDNIRKFVFYLFSCNVAEILVLLIAGLAGLPAPLLPLQILWLNMVTDTLPALALAVEPGDADVMKRPPRNPKEAILSRGFLTGIAIYGALITASTLAVFLWALAHAPAQATTMSFMTLALAQILHLGNARSERRGRVARARVRQPVRDRRGRRVDRPAGGTGGDRAGGADSPRRAARRGPVGPRPGAVVGHRAGRPGNEARRGPVALRPRPTATPDDGCARHGEQRRVVHIP